MKVLIAGALGHIGSGLIEYLLKNTDYSIHAIDNLKTQRYSTLLGLKPGSNFSFTQQDLSLDNTDLSLENIDVVINLAALTDPEQSFLEPEATIDHNLSIVKKLAQKCVSANVPLIHISSTSIFSGENSVICDDNFLEHVRPHTPYAKSKWLEEKYIEEIGLSQNLQYCILRFGTIYGFSLGMRFHTAINKFCWQVLTNQQVTIWKTALHQVRPYLSLEDGVQAIAFIIQNRLYNNISFNVVTENLSIQDVLQKFEELNIKINISIIESKSMNDASFIVNPDGLLSHGFKPKGNLITGISGIMSKFNILRPINGMFDR